ncbi:hypothetical protein [Actinomadura sp. SCN-SB]|uniref:hypothetical protein n=1 Tax=Actinomadura sp. SCN-SB TaxID=3373092 RepID=UPI003753DE12
MNELRAVILVFALIGLGIFFFAGVSEVDSQDQDSTKSLLMAGFCMISCAMIAAGALAGLGRPSASRATRVSFGGRGEVMPPPPYGQPYAPVPPQPGQAPPPPQ